MKRPLAAALGSIIAGMLAVGMVAAAPLHATATGRTGVNVGSAGKTDAKDKWSTGTITTPKATAQGKAVVANTSYKIAHGKKTVAATNRSGSRFALSTGTYTVTTSVKYRTYTEKMVTVPGGAWSWKDTSDLNGLEVSTCQRTGKVAIPEGYAAARFAAECRTPDGVLYRGDYWIDLTPIGDDWDAIVVEIADTHPLSTWVTPSFVGPGLYPEQKWVQGTTTKVERTYSAYKTATRSQTVTIANSATMTLREYKAIKNKMSYSKVRRTVGGGGTVISRYSVGDNDYIVREFDGEHRVYFKNGKVHAKVW